ncbi:MAG: hypothetical protein ACYCWB_14535 [Thiobacillus sp.]
MRKLILVAAIIAVSSPVLGAECRATGELAQSYLKDAKAGINQYQMLASDNEKMWRIGMERSLVLLVVSQGVWDNRHSYSSKQAYEFGYKICVDMR